MTSQKDQIQALITDIDGVLQKTTPRLPWVVSGEVTQQRQVLERVRNYLVAFQRRQIASEGFRQPGARPDLLAHDIYYQPQQAPYPPAPTEFEPEDQSPSYGQADVSAQQMLQAIAQEMGALRATVMQPLQSDLEILRQQREQLVQEIRQLEAQRQGYGGQIPGQQQVIAEFLQALMSRLQETLPQQVAQTLAGTSTQPALPYAAPSALAGTAPSVTTASDAPYQGLGSIQVPQSQSDALLIKLDSTLSVVFESLQRNVQAYQESLSQGLDKMHSMGQQGEMMFTALITHLAQQLGREASSYLQSSIPTGLEPSRTQGLTGTPATSAGRTPSPGIGSVDPSLVGQSNLDPAIPNLTLPFPGTEISSPPVNPAAVDAPPPSVDTAIDYWLRSAGKTDAPSDVDLEIAALDLEGFDLNQLAAQDVNSLLELDANLLGNNLPPQPILPPIAPEAAIPGTPPSAGDSPATMEDTADIDAALKLLEQLSSELQDQPVSVADADAQIDRMLNSPASLTSGSDVTDGTPDDARDELDDFYESLFGSNAAPAETPPETPTETPASLDSIPPAAEPSPTVASSDAVAAASPAAAPIALPTTGPESVVSSTVAQPIDTLPAEIQTPEGGHLASVTGAPPVNATDVDPTLGWDLSNDSTAMSVSTPESDTASPATIESDIPEALLEDELLGVWDLADTEAGVAEAPETPATSEDLLGGWDIAPIEHSAPVVDDASPIPTDTPSIPFDSPTAAVDPLPATVANDSATATPTTPTTVHDEIAALTDLFDEASTATGASDSAESSIATEASLQPLADVPPLPIPDRSTTVPPSAAAQTINSQQPPIEDDRFTPALPEEDLLPTTELAAEPESELWLDETTLNRLSEDLFNLEEAIVEPDASDSTEPALDESLFQLDSLIPDAPAASTSDPALMDDTSLLSSLDEAATTPSPTNFVPGSGTDETPTIMAESPGAFTLEGMDDLFADTPIAPPVTSVPPPVAPGSSEPSGTFTLEGMNDLFGDAPSASEAPAASAPAIDQSQPFTLEGMDDLFSESEASPASSPPAAEPAPSVPESPQAFTLEGTGDLFGNLPPVSSPSVPPATDQSPFTLDGVDDLFSDVPPLASPPPSAIDQPLPFTLEGMDDLFSDIPPVSSGSPNAPTAESTAPVEQSPPTADFTLEQVGDLFVEVPAGGLSAPDAAAEAVAPAAPSEPSTAAPPPFTLEQMGNLFVEVPAGSAAPTSDQTIAPPIDSSLPSNSDAIAPFTLEQMGDVFIETPTGAAPAGAVTAADNPVPSATPPLQETAEPTLDQAFVSLLGLFDDDATPTADSPDAASSDQKKKEIN